jgi:hypothetical protein
MKYPIELITDIAVKLRSYQTLFRWKHVMSFRVTRAGRIKEAHRTFCGVHGLSVP